MTGVFVYMIVLAKYELSGTAGRGVSGVNGLIVYCLLTLTCGHV
jgi:hypothetical protein